MNLDALRFHLFDDCPNRFFVVSKPLPLINVVAVDLYQQNMLVLAADSYGKKILQTSILKRQFDKKLGIHLWKRKIGGKWEFIYYNFLTSEILEGAYQKFLLSLNKYEGTLEER